MKLTYEQAEQLYNKHLTIYDIYKKPSDSKIKIYLQLKQKYNYQFIASTVVLVTLLLLQNAGGQ